MVRDKSSLARFGAARLVRNSNGDYQLLGGTAADRTAAKEWVSLFMHEAAVSFWPGRRTTAIHLHLSD